MLVLVTDLTERHPQPPFTADLDVVMGDAVDERDQAAADLQAKGECIIGGGAAPTFRIVPAAAAAEPVPTLIEREADPRTPGRTAYRISGERNAVAAAIVRLMIDRAVSVSEFTTAKPLGDGRYGALGYTIARHARAVA
jgi:hypothetical protein